MTVFIIVHLFDIVEWAGSFSNGSRSSQCELSYESNKNDNDLEMTIPNTENRCVMTAMT